jgi:hypothetical protein
VMSWRAARSTGRSGAATPDPHRPGHRGHQPDRPGRPS